MRHGLDLPGCFPTGRHYPGIAHLMRVAVAGLAEDFAADQPLATLPVVSIDTETTGRDPAQDRIVEIACVTLLEGEIRSRKSWLVRPDRPIPEEARAVHGIRDEDVQGCPTFSEQVGVILKEMQGAVPLAYNADYDREILHAELGRAQHVPEERPPAARRSVKWLDPLIWARELQKLEKGKSLGEVTQRLGIPVGQAHRAQDDAEAALGVFLAFARDPRVPRTYGAFLQEQRRLSRLQDEERRRWRARPSGA